jgi:hypothetical protein
MLVDVPSSDSEHQNPQIGTPPVMNLPRLIETGRRRPIGPTWTLALIAATSLASALLAGESPEADGTLYEGIGPPWNEGRYVGQWTDGATLSADEVTPWDQTDSTPSLAGRALFSPENSIRWLLDTDAAEAAEPKAFIELVGGDRLPGRVIGFADGSEPAGRRLPPHLIVAPYIPLAPPREETPAAIRVATEWVRRIVWKAADAKPGPQTLALLDGRQLGFRSLRFAEASVRILRQDGIQEIPLVDLAEIRLAEEDPWNAYFDQVAVLSPKADSRLVRLECSTGLRATGSLEQFQVRAVGDRKHPSSWYHLCQPAWSLDPLWVCHTDIRLRCYFMPNEVPLSAISPTAIRQRSDLGGSWLPQIDRNPRGGQLASGGRWFAWGFGVHAACALEFPLPECICRFRTQLGLDRVAGSGGCVRAQVRLEPPAGDPLYESDNLVGSDRVATCAPMVIRFPRLPQTRLVLEVDAAHEGRPDGADPFDIRDDFDWLEPLLELDPGWLGKEIFRRAAGRIPAWQGWTVTSGGAAGARLVNYWDESSAGSGTYRLLAAPESAELKLEATLSVRPQRERLLIAVCSPPHCGRSWLEVLVDGQSAAQFDVPQRHGRDAPEPLAVSLAEHQGREVAVELIQRSMEPPAAVEWRAITLTDSL